MKLPAIGLILPGDMVELLPGRIVSGRLGGQGYIYIAEFNRDCLLKIGRSVNLSERIRTHNENGEGFGFRIQRVWFSPPHTRYGANESKLLRRISRLASVQRRSEFFLGCSFEGAVLAAQDLDYHIEERPPLPKMERLVIDD